LIQIEVRAPFYVGEAGLPSQILNGLLQQTRGFVKVECVLGANRKMDPPGYQRTNFLPVSGQESRDGAGLLYFSLAGFSLVVSYYCLPR
jgi:hypothetical protein